jgi:hypothetical protein
VACAAAGEGDGEAAGFAGVESAPGGLQAIRTRAIALASKLTLDRFSDATDPEYS